MTEKEKKQLDALYNIRKLHENMIDELTRLQADNTIIDEMLEKLWQIIQEIKEIEQRNQ